MQQLTSFLPMLFITISKLNTEHFMLLYQSKANDNSKAPILNNCSAIYPTVLGKYPKTKCLMWNVK